MLDVVTAAKVHACQKKGENKSTSDYYANRKQNIIASIISIGNIEHQI